MANGGGWSADSINSPHDTGYKYRVIVYSAAGATPKEE